MKNTIQKQTGFENRLWWFVFCIGLWLPFFNLGWDWSGQVISIADSEFPVKVWSYITFSDPSMWFGGLVDTASFPNQGALNNPDIFAGVFFWCTSFLPLGLRFNLLLLLVMGLNVLSGVFLVRQFSVSKWVALLVGFFWAWQPLLLSYGFASNITDLTHVWPYAMGLGFLQRALVEDNTEDGQFAGLFFALGFVTCPYSFVLFIPILPMLIWWVRRNSDRWVSLLWNLSWVAGGLLLLYGARVGYVMQQEGSLVAADTVESVRHVYPFDGLRADKETRFTAFLMEMTGLYPRPVVIMEQVARFSRHFQWGVITLGLVVMGLVVNRGFRWFALSGIVVGIGTSIGPFVSIDPFTELSNPYNPVYWWSYTLPLGKMILEPFRYVLVAGVFMTPLVGMALHRMKRWGLLLGVLMLGEMAWRSPQFLLPTQPIAWDARLDSLEIEEGGVVHLPFFVSHSNRFDRRHFLYQLQHQRPISDPIMGFPAPFTIENAVLCQLIHAETVIFPMEFFPCSVETLRKGWVELQEVGVRTILIDSTLYAPADWQKVQRIIQTLPVEPIEKQGLFMVKIPTKPE